MAKTAYSSSGITTIANNLGVLMDDMAPFNDLKPHWPNAGKFPLAQWLERIVDDRRNAIVAHAEHLHTTLEDAQTTLLQIAKDFDHLDGDTAGKIKKTLADLKTTIGSEWSSWDGTTESAQGNFHKGKDGNNSDGDGYNDDLTGPVG